MATKSYSLLMQLGPAQGETVPVSGEEFVLGRDPASNWMIKDVEVSRRHARLLADGEGYAIEDLGSTNGTFVNGQRIRTVVPLLPGATIRLGENVLLFFDANADAKAGSETRSFSVQSSANEAEEPEVAPSPENGGLQQEKSQSLEIRQSEPVSQEGVGIPQPLVREKAGNEATGLPFFHRPLVIGFAALVLLGICALTTFLWYVDANYLWCDVFGNLIAACR